MEATTGEDGLAVAERLRAAVEALEFEAEGQRIPLTLSAGVASFPELYIKTAAELILFADEALYEAKRRGRNRCLLDIGQGRYMDVEGSVLATEEAGARGGGAADLRVKKSGAPRTRRSGKPPKKGPLRFTSVQFSKNDRSAWTLP